MVTELRARILISQPSADQPSGQQSYLGTDEHGNHVFGQPTGSQDSSAYQSGQSTSESTSQGSGFDSEGTLFGSDQGSTTSSTGAVYDAETGRRIDPVTGQPVEDTDGGTPPA